jgi:putative addiction module component (TIGR02574 family)
MPRSFDQARQFALELPYEDRARLSRELWESLHPPAENLSQEEIDAFWDAEIKRRLDDIDSGTVELAPLEEVLARMDARILAKRRG